MLVVQRVRLARTFRGPSSLRIRFISARSSASGSPRPPPRPRILRSGPRSCLLGHHHAMHGMPNPEQHSQEAPRPENGARHDPSSHEGPQAFAGRTASLGRRTRVLASLSRRPCAIYRSSFRARAHAMASLAHLSCHAWTSLSVLTTPSVSPDVSLRPARRPLSFAATTVIVQPVHRCRLARRAVPSRPTTGAVQLDGHIRPA